MVAVVRRRSGGKASGRDFRANQSIPAQASSNGLSTGIYGNGEDWNGVEKLVHSIQQAAARAHNGKAKC